MREPHKSDAPRLDHGRTRPVALRGELNTPEGNTLMIGGVGRGKTPAAALQRAMLEAADAEFEETTNPATGTTEFRIRRAEA
ncbi:hypothetical protein ACFY0G_40540 [Streptomyces sp. NPDC001552]|uniref:hypothetical protein n=1 Tax=Streptomyces sp. NPDC001552 TaxID=3364587 RepID=UPI0036C58B43